MIDALLLREISTAGQALNTLKTSASLARDTLSSWIEVWEKTVFDPANSFLWIGLVTLGLNLAALCILYLVTNEGKEIVEKQDWGQLIKMLVWPLIVAIMLGKNGYLLSESVKMLRVIGLSAIEQVQTIQIAGTTAEAALDNILVGNAGREQIESIINGCKDKTGQPLYECLSQAKTDIENIVADAESVVGGAEAAALVRFGEDLLESLTNALGNLASGNGTDAVDELIDFTFRNTAIPLIRGILAAVQWAFVNILEAALLLSALFAPVAMGLSLLPLQGRPIIAWLVGFISVIGIQLGYNIIVGVTAIVITKANGEFFTDIAFSCFLAIFAPALAVAFGRGGGQALYQAISNGVQQLVKVSSQIVATAAKAAAG
jgi:hypothetical protein